MTKPIDATELQNSLHTHTLGRHAELHGEIGSTNSRAVELARQGAPSGTLVLAELQTQGRGRLRRRWHAPRGSSLLMSLLLRPPLAPRQAQRLTMVCSLAAIEGIRRVTGLEGQVKWPNDVYLQERKLGGVLTELGLEGQALVYAVVGMGLNINLDVAALPEVMTPATSLSAALGREVSRLDVLVAILEAAEERYDRLVTGWSPAAEWCEHLLTLGRDVSVSAGDEVIEGRAEGVDDDGALLVRTRDGGLRTVVAGDVSLRRRAPGAA